ncbi:MAG: glycosyltransferase family 4 protein [Verrucomicrobiae bacterium]
MTDFAYLFERFPTFTQTFCYREVLEMRRQGCRAPVYSIRRPDDIPQDCPKSLAADVRYLPEPPALGREMKTLRMLGRYPWPVIQQVRTWGKRPGKARLLEAAWLGPKLRADGIRHVHAHFAGIAARTAWWMKRFYGITFSFTGHANDMFCETESPVPLGDLVREAAFVVAVSDFSREWLCRRVPGLDAKIHRIYNGMDLAGFPAQAPSPGPHRIVSIGRCIEKKGFDDLIDSCAILRKKNLDFACEIIGGGPLEDRLRARIAELGLHDCVTLTGPLPQEEVRRRLASATLFVLPCVTETDGGMDTLPTVIVEAMAAGLPVISTRLAAIPEMVGHGVTGLLVDEKQPAQLAEAMAEILRDPDLAGRFGRAGKRAAAGLFASEPTVASLRDFLERTPGG